MSIAQRIRRSITTRFKQGRSHENSQPAYCCMTTKIRGAQKSLFFSVWPTSSIEQEIVCFAVSQWLAEAFEYDLTRQFALKCSQDVLSSKSLHMFSVSKSTVATRLPTMMVCRSFTLRNLAFFRGLPTSSTKMARRLVSFSIINKTLVNNI